MFDKRQRSLKRMLDALAASKKLVETPSPGLRQFVPYTNAQIQAVNDHASRHQAEKHWPAYQRDMLP